MTIREIILRNKVIAIDVLQSMIPIEELVEIVFEIRLGYTWEECEIGTIHALKSMESELI
jgi:hypothetical protein